ncbi:hypothetical protein MtrunA17_Chr1g0198841 [Medicago truncatula]|uniref:Uncharacterized protein n=1 Tax=Medicago truncatula TaxID=3880 RepID=A0A396JZD8_MEDTR|nr:hypothetical protein MtrunA17_Chr1g0198841 [Medicago truncatula]
MLTHLYAYLWPFYTTTTTTTFVKVQIWAEIFVKIKSRFALNRYQIGD